MAAIRGLVNQADPTFETDWLDFKAEHRDPKQRDAKARERKFREQLCEAISGFANNQGGVIVWGIVAEKRPVGGDYLVDAAWEEMPVTNPLAVKSRTSTNGSSCFAKRHIEMAAGKVGELAHPELPGIRWLR